MKKIISVLCVAILLMSLSACGNSGSGDAGTTTDGGEKVAFDAQINHIQANACYTYGLKADGTLIASSEPFIDGDNVVKTLPECLTWTGVQNFSSGSEAVAAVLEDGSVVMCGGLVDEMQNCDFDAVSGWKDVVQVAMGKRDIVALKSDGSVEIAGMLQTKDIGDNTGFVQVEAECEPMGVKADGSVVIWNWSWDDSVEEAAQWTDIKSISSCWNHIVGLKSDGTVVACGNNDFGQCDVGEWTDIVAVSAGMDFTLGLKSDGTVVVCGQSDAGACDVENWSDVVEIDAGYYHSAGICSDGSVLTAGANYQGQCNTDEWDLK